jgi:hypothetical protein
MLTDNTTHDIGPRINGDYIIWQSEEVSGWKVRIYNVLTGDIESIDDTDGASIENPRLVLVYDAKHENGDVETRGYDLDTGKNIALAAQSGKIPDKLPDPDQTGEERALIATVTQIKQKTEEDDGIEPEPLEPAVVDNVFASTTNDVVIPPFSDESTQSEETLLDSDSDVSDIPDVVVTGPISPEYVPPVVDLVVPPFTPQDVVPQQDVASEG